MSKEEDIIEKLKQRCNDRNFEFITFVNQNNSIIKRRCLVKCKTCGEEYEFSVSRFYDKKLKCKNCSSNINSFENKAINNIQNVCNDEGFVFMGFDDGRYINSNTKIIFKCLRCGQIINRIKYKDFVYRKQKPHICEDLKKKTSIIRCEEHAKCAEDEIREKLKNTNFDFVEFVGGSFVGKEKTKVLVKCKKCNNLREIFYVNIMLPSFSGICRKCTPFSRKSKKYTTEILNKRCEELGLEFVCISDEQKINQRTKIITRCKDCGNLLRPVSLGHFFKNGKKCEFCYNDGMYTQQQVEEKINKICEEHNWDFNGYCGGYFKNTRSHIKIHCNNCNVDFITRANSLWHGNDYICHSCKTELKNKNLQKRIKTRERHLIKIKDILHETCLEFISFVEDVSDTKKPHVLLKCKHCGQIMQYSCETLFNHHQPKRCKCCGYYQLSEDNAIKIITKLCDKYGFIFDGFDTSDQKYQGVTSNIFVICKKCLHRWSISNFSFFKRKRFRCPNCEKRVWAMEKEIETLLKNKNIKYIFQCNKKYLPWLTYKRSLSLDFYLPEYNIAIECQGDEHFKPIEYFGGKDSFEAQMERDIVKLNLCKEHGVTLLYYDNSFKNKSFLNEQLYSTTEEILNQIENCNNI